MAAPPVLVEVKPGVQVLLRAPLDDDELWWYVQTLWGVKLGRVAVCPGHDAPFQAFADAYFARHRMIVIKGSRLFGGKTFQLAHLALTEEVALAAGVIVLGGSGSQSEKCIRYINDAWKRPTAPKGLLLGDLTKRHHALANGGEVTAIAASTKQARSPHVNRVRLDEVDEMELKVFDAAAGIGTSIAGKGVPAQTTITSTKQYATGTMATIEERIAEGTLKARQYQWCYKESIAAGWLPASEVEAKRDEVVDSMWMTEFDLEDLDPSDLAIHPDTVEQLFKARHPVGLDVIYEGRIGEELVIEEPQEDGWYATGADWAKETHWSVAVTLRWDVRPARVVAFRRDGRRPWPLMVGSVDERIARYPARPGFYPACHDATGIGNVVEDYLKADADPVEMVGKVRRQLFSDYLLAIEHGEISWPMIKWAYGEHRHCTLEHLFGSKHPPDSVVTGALAWRATMRRRAPGRVSKVVAWG